MKLLIDTQVILWWLGEDKRLGKNALSTLADADISVFVSMASLWEVSIKHGLGKLPANADQIVRWLDHWSINILHISLPHLSALERLPHVHRDPFDRIIVAQAMVEDLIVMTADEKLQAYAITTISAKQ